MEKHICYGCMNQIQEDVCPHCGYTSGQDNPAHQLPVGTMLRQQYLVGRVLGQGGFGITYLGWDTYLDIPVAIKEFYPNNLVGRDNALSNSPRINYGTTDAVYYSNLERFVREAKALAKLRRLPQIVGVQSFFRENNTAYIIMEYVRGVELKEYVRRRGGKLSVHETLLLLQPIMEALVTVHKEGLVHRDISPDNIMLHPTEGAKLLDFGAVRYVENPDAEKDLTRSTEAIVKHGFAPMEQYRGKGGIGPWTDCYALCATIYYCLTGKVPPDALTRSMDDEDIAWAEVPGLTDLQRAALETGTSLRAKDRYESLEELYRLLYGESAVDPPTTEPAQPPINPADSPARKKPVRSQRSSKVPGVIWAFIAVLLLAGLVYFIIKPFAGDLIIPTPESTLPETIGTVPETTEPHEPWEYNTMSNDPWSVMALPRDAIRTVTFLDSTATAPESAVDITLYAMSGQVLAWENEGNVFIAAEGGINGQHSCEGLFADCVNLTAVTFGDAFHTDFCTNMREMFRACISLETVDAENLNTSRTENMHRMFCMLHGSSENFIHDGNFALKHLDVSNWDVSSVTEMEGLFQGCQGLEHIDVGNWDVSSVTVIGGIFWKCSSLVEVDVSTWDVSSVISAGEAFAYCETLTTVPVDNWNTENLEYAQGMFMGCKRLSSLDVSHWNTAKLRNVTRMLNGTALPWPDLSGWDTSSIEAYDSFYYEHVQRLNRTLIFGS